MPRFTYLDKKAQANLVSFDDLKLYDKFLIKPSKQVNTFLQSTPYRDMDYLIFFDNYTLIEEFVSDLKIVLQSFCYMAIYYCQKKLNHENFTKFLEDITIVFPLFPKINN